MSFKKETIPGSDFMMNVALGRAAGYSTEFAVGHTPEIGIGAEKTIWDDESLKVPISVAANVFVSSDSVSDTGGPTILVNALDENYNPTILGATINGQSQVQLINIMGGSDLAIWVQSAIIRTNNVAGDIYVALSDSLSGGVPQTVGSIQSRINFPNNVTRNGFYMVPNGKSAIFTAIRANTNDMSKIANVITQVTQFGEPPIRGNEYVVTPDFPGVNLMLPFASTAILGVDTASFPARTAIEYIALPSSNNTVVTVGFDLIIVDESMIGPL